MVAWIQWQPDRRRRPDILTPAERLRLTRWSEAYRAEAVYGAEDGNKWAFARYLRLSGRLSEHC